MHTNWYSFDLKCESGDYCLVKMHFLKVHILSYILKISVYSILKLKTVVTAIELLIEPLNVWLNYIKYY